MNYWNCHWYWKGISQRIDIAIDVKILPLPMSEFQEKIPENTTTIYATWQLVTIENSYYVMIWPSKLTLICFDLTSSVITVYLTGSFSLHYCWNFYGILLSFVRRESCIGKNWRERWTFLFFSAKEHQSLFVNQHKDNSDCIIQGIEHPEIICGCM